MSQSGGWESHLLSPARQFPQPSPVLSPLQPHPQTRILLLCVSESLRVNCGGIRTGCGHGTRALEPPRSPTRCGYFNRREDSPRLEPPFLLGFDGLPAEEEPGFIWQTTPTGQKWLTLEILALGYYYFLISVIFTYHFLLRLNITIKVAQWVKGLSDRPDNLEFTPGRRERTSQSHALALHSCIYKWK